MSHDNSSLKSTKVQLLRHCHNDSSSQTASSSPQDQRAWSEDLETCLHRSQTELSMMVRRTRFSLVGRELRHAFHTRFFILFRTCIDHKVLHRCLSSILCASSSSVYSSALRNLYPDLELYTPLLVNGQNKVSSASHSESGMVLIKFASTGEKMPSIISLCHCRVDSLISKATFASASNSTVGERTCGGCFLGDH